MDFLPIEIDNYTCNHTKAESELLQKINRETHANVMMPRMLSGHLQGRVLSMLSNMIKPKNILEIGTYTGYSALCLAEGLSENGKLYTIDINEELASRVKEYFAQSEHSKQIDYYIGNALEIIPKLNVNFDLVFIDADKENYANYYNMIIEKVSVGGFIIADNVLWSGKVLLDKNKMDKDTKAIDEFNKMIQKDSRVENVLFPIRDGLMVIRKL